MMPCGNSYAVTTGALQGGVAKNILPCSSSLPVYLSLLRRVPDGKGGLMYILYLNDKTNYSFSTSYYIYDNEKRADEVARKMAGEGVECTLFKPYKKYATPLPEVVVTTL
jgi:hypothetical protein